MNPFEFESDLETGVDSIDECHRRLIAVVNRVVSDDFEHFGLAWFGEALAGLVDFTNYAFAAEEDLMRRFKDPAFKSHRAWHDQFRLEISELADAARQVTTTKGLRLELAHRIESWLLPHFRVEDKQLANHTLKFEPKGTLRLADSETLRRSGILVAEIDVSAVPLDCIQKQA